MVAAPASAARRPNSAPTISASAIHERLRSETERRNIIAIPPLGYERLRVRYVARTAITRLQSDARPVVWLPTGQTATTWVPTACRRKPRQRRGHFRGRGAGFDVSAGVWSLRDCSCLPPHACDRDGEATQAGSCSRFPLAE